TILAQEHPLERSSVSIRWDPGKRRFVGTTENVFRIVLDPALLPDEGPVILNLDSQHLTAQAVQVGLPEVAVERVNGRWADGASLSANEKNPGAYGPFNDAFRKRMVFVYGTRGTQEE